MDGARFDDLTRRLAVALSRRGMLRLLGGSLVGAVSTTLMPATPAWGQVREQVMPPGSELIKLIKQLLGDDLERLRSAANHDENWKLLLQFAETILGLRRGPVTAWASDVVNFTRCVSFLRTVLLTPTGDEAAILQWGTVERPGERPITLAYLHDKVALYAVTNGAVSRTSTNAVLMPWPRIRRVCERACQLVRDGKDGQAPCDVVVPLMELCVSKILEATGQAQLAFELTLAVKTVCHAMRLGCALGDCAACNPPCGPDQQCLESGNAGPRCCKCPKTSDLPWKCCVAPDGTVYADGCCLASNRCGWPARLRPPATTYVPFCAMGFGQCQGSDVVCTN